MANLLYSWPSDNVASEATVTTDGTAETMYPVANLYDLNPAKPCKIAETTGSFLWTFPSDQHIEVVAIVHHNLTPGAVVKIQGNATDSWGSPTLDQTITIPAYWEDGMPVNPLKDLSALNNHTFKYWRLAVVSGNTNPIVLGEVVLLSTKRNFTTNIAWGSTFSEERPVIEHNTDYMVPTIYSYGVSKRSISGALNTTDAGAAELRSWYRACGGRALPFLLQIDGGVVNDCWLARFTNTQLDLVREFVDVNTTTLSFDEVARGLYY